MAIPIGLETGISRMPRATLALVFLLVVAFVLQMSYPGVRSDETSSRYVQLLAYYTQNKDLELPAELQRLHDQPDTLDLRVWIAILSSDLQTKPTNDARQATLNRLANGFLQAVHSRPEYRFGYRPSGPKINILLSLFLHPDVLQLLGNLLLLYLVGTKLEDLWGGLTLLILFVLGSMACAYIYMVYSPNPSPVIGSSGGIAVLMGAFLVRLMHLRVRMFALVFNRPVVFTLPAFIVLIFWIFGELYLLEVGLPGSEIIWVHLGGFVLGALAGLLIRLTPLERMLETPQQQKIRLHDTRPLQEARNLSAAGHYKQAIEQFRAYLSRFPKDPQAWEDLAKALRADKADPKDAALRAALEWLEVQQLERANGLMQEFKLRLKVTDAMRIHRNLAFDDAKQLLQKTLLAAPNDTYAPKAALILSQVYPDKENLEVLRLVADFSEDDLWRERLLEEIGRITEKIIKG